MKTHILKFALTTGVAFATTLTAGIIPYPDKGTQNPLEYSLTAQTTGPITAYFYGSGAAYSETLGLFVNGISTGITGLNNHSSPIGQSLDLGHAKAGDSLDFFIDVADTQNTFYSNKSMNADGANHVYSTAFSGNSIIPAGTYIGFEDLALNVADFNYTDEQFVISNVSTTGPSSSTPEPESVALVGVAGLLLAALRRLRSKA